MIKFALKGGDQSAAHADAGAQDEHIAPVPRISIQAFCDLRRHCRRDAGGGRRSAHDQGASEGADGRHRGGDRSLPGIRDAKRRHHRVGWRRGEYCSPVSIRLPRSATPARASIVIGHLNDIVLYREMVRRGVSDYLIAPVGPVDLIRAVSGPVLCGRRQAGRPHARGGRRQGRRRLLDGRAQHRLGDRARRAS